MDVAILHRGEGDGGAGLAMAAQGHPQFQAAGLQQPGEQDQPVRDRRRRVPGILQGGEQGRGQVPAALVVEDELGILGVQVSPHHQPYPALVADQGGEALGGGGQGGGAEIARYPVIALAQAQGREIEVLEQVAGGAPVAGLPGPG